MANNTNNINNKYDTDLKAIKFSNIIVMNGNTSLTRFWITKQSYLIKFFLKYNI